jgi:hypothetical protein
MNTGADLDPSPIDPRPDLGHHRSHGMVADNGIGAGGGAGAVAALVRP